LTACVLSATLLGLFAGMAPGPYTTMVAATGLERGFRDAIPIALAPLLTDLPPLLVATLVVRRLNWTALTLLGLCGGVVIAMVGVRFLRTHRRRGVILPATLGTSSRSGLHGSSSRAPAAEKSREGGRSASASEPGTESSIEVSHARQTVRVGHVLTTNLLNPAPWVFWFVAGAPLFLVQLRQGWGRGAVFLIVFFLINVSSAGSLAWLASHARRLLAPRNQRRVLLGAGVTLTFTGAFMVWQAIEGNFQALIEGQTAVRSVFGSAGTR